jgi:hypothetical protein
MLHWIAAQRGYREGWAARQYKERFGVWPKGLIDYDVPADVEVSNWVRSRLIRFAKSQAAKAAA